MIKRESYSLSIYPIYAVLLILSACGGLPTKPLIKVLQPQQPLPLVLAISEQVLRCDPQILMQEAPLSSKPRIHLITNAQRLKNLSKLEAPKRNFVFCIKRAQEFLGFEPSNLVKAIENYTRSMKEQ